MMRTAFFWLRVWAAAWVLFFTARSIMTLAGYPHRTATAICWLMFISEELRTWGGWGIQETEDE